MKHNLFSDAFGEFGGVSKQGWLAMFIFGAVNAGGDVLAWSDGAGFSSIDYMSAAAATPVALVASYLASMSMISRRESAIGFLRFAAAFFAVFSLFVIGIGGLLEFLPNSHKGFIVPICVILIVLGWLVSIFLPALPVAQALSSKTISPLRLLRATKGHRWSLFLVPFVASALNHILPSTAKAQSLTQAVLYAAGNSAVGVFSLTFFVAVSVTAWRYASANDKKLYGDDPRAVNAF